MADVKIAIINETTVVSDPDLQNAVAALQIQVSRDFAPVWKRDAQLIFVPKGGTAPTDAWQLIACDDSNVAGALGYHEMTPDGQPIGYAALRTDIEAGESWTTTLSHELLEMLVDPWIDDIVLYDNGDGTGVLYPKEVCDACEADQYGYKITVNGADGKPVDILVSDFVYPAFFQQNSASGSQYDFQKQISAPFQVLSGGYLGELPITEDPNGWNQITADHKPSRKGNAAPLGSRRERRTSKKHWKKSRAR
jgi:hypothetical protein